MDDPKNTEYDVRGQVDGTDFLSAADFSDISDSESPDVAKESGKTKEEIMAMEKKDKVKESEMLPANRGQDVNVDVGVADVTNSDKITEDSGDFDKLQDTSSSDIPPSMSPASDKDGEINDREVNSKGEFEKSAKTSMCAGEFSPELYIQNIQIQTITVDEDEDLFDFQHSEGIGITNESGVVDDNEASVCEIGQIDETNKSKFELEKDMPDENSQDPHELKKMQLYKYLTASHVNDVKSTEVTPLQTPLASDHESNEDDSGSESESSESGSYSDATSNSQDEQDHESPNKEAEDTMETTLNDELVQEPEQPSEEEPEPPIENNVVEKPKPTPVRKTFRPRLTKKMRSILAKTQERIKKSKEVTDKWLKELELPKNLDLSNPVKLDINDLNQYLTCGLCSGYLYEASTVTECMHTFCKTCIVKHCMEVSLNCPVCNILIHPTDPFVNIRLDRMIQDIVYKLLPNVADAEMKNIREFYADHPDVEAKELNNCPDRPKPSPAKSDVVTVTSPLVSLVLESESESSYENDQLEKKYVRVKGTATVENVSHFLKMKLQLEESQNVDIFCCGDLLEESNSTLQTIKEKFFNNEQNCLMLLQYRIGDA